MVFGAIIFLYHYSEILLKCLKSQIRKTYKQNTNTTGWITTKEHTHTQRQFNEIQMWVETMTTSLVYLLVMGWNVQNYIPSPKPSRWAVTHPTSYSVTAWILSRWSTGRCMTVTTHNHVEPILKMCRVYTSAPLYAFMARTGTTLPLTLLAWVRVRIIGWLCK
jgi:hypothetical protein